MLEQAQIDYLTGFFLRDSLDSVLEELMRKALNDNKNFSMALIDLDRFKRFNDRFGHAMGDEVLKYTANMLHVSLTGNGCYFFRYGGDEYIVIFPDKGPREIIPLLRKCGYDMRRQPFIFRNKLYRITTSSGIAGFPKDGRSMDELIKKADKAMYASKKLGRNVITLAQSLAYLRLRGIFTIVLSIIIIPLILFIFYQMEFFKENVRPAIDQVKNLKIMTEPDIDIITLKNGKVFKGHIAKEDEDEIMLKLDLEKGEGVLIFSKSKIAHIKYSPQTLRRKTISAN